MAESFGRRRKLLIGDTDKDPPGKPERVFFANKNITGSSKDANPV
ncbi:hypothetical protein [Afipia felis]|nr:hypothetical protein [Afipia felis]